MRMLVMLPLFHASFLYGWSYAFTLEGLTPLATFIFYYSIYNPTLPSSLMMRVFRPIAIVLVIR